MSENEAQLIGDLLRLFCLRKDTYTIQEKDGKHYRQQVPVTVDLIKKHLQGEVTTGLYQLQPGTNLVKWLCPGHRPSASRRLKSGRG